MFLHPGGQALIELFGENDARVDGGELLFGDDDAQAETGRPAAVLHALTDIEIVNGADGGIGSEDFLDEAADACVIAAFQGAMRDMVPSGSETIWLLKGKLRHRRGIIRLNRR